MYFDVLIDSYVLPQQKIQLKLKNSITTLTKMCGKLFLFFSYYNSWLRKASFASTIALWKKGVDTVRSPLFNQDLTSGIFAALADPGTKGQIFEAMGPQSFVQVLIARNSY